MKIIQKWNIDKKKVRGVTINNTKRTGVSILYIYL